MSNKVGVGISAELDTSDVERRINDLGQKVAQANNVQFSPISVKSVEQIDAARKKFEQLLKVHGELNRRVKSTGQSGKSSWDMDYESMFPNDRSRARQTRTIMEYTFGAQFKELKPPTQVPPATPTPGGGKPSAHPAHPQVDKPKPSAWTGMGAGVAQAGLRAAGPAGGVAAGAVGTGMSAGFGAGMMGLMGGMLALGAGKVIGSVTEKISDAEANNIALDKLKRTLGDVNVSFEALKGAVHGSADQLKITHAEAGRLAQQFAKQGNLSGDQYGQLPQELAVGVGLSKSFGMESAQGVGVMGQVRGVGATSSTQDSRRFALLIGETIGKSGAFAKADEVMDAIAGYTVAQTRSMTGNANTAGFAGMYASMVGSGVAGLDPEGAKAMLGRVNSSLAAGGAKGEASQFLTARVGQRLGLDPMQTQVFREGGMFATKRSQFGEGSAFARYTGEAMKLGSDADTTHFSARLAELKRDPSYAKNPMLLAQAMANDTGLNMNQAMTLMQIEPQKMGELAGMTDLSKLNAKGIGTLVKAQYGTADERQSIAREFLGRTGSDALATDDRDKIKAAMGDDGKLRDVLTKIAGNYDQEMTLGKSVQESKAVLENIKTTLADKMVPLMNEMRLGVMYIAGKGNKSSAEIVEDMLKLDHKGEVKVIDGRYKTDLSENDEQRVANRMEQRDFVHKNVDKVASGELTQAEYDRQLAILHRREAELTEQHNKIKEAYTKELEAAKDKLKEDVAALRAPKVDAVSETAPLGTPVLGGRGNINPPFAIPGSKGNGKGAILSSPGAGAGGDALASGLSDIEDPQERANVKAMLDGIAHVEGAGYNTLVGHGRNNQEITDLDKHPNKVGMVTGDGVSTAAGRYQITGTTWRGVQKQLGLKDFSPESQDKAAIELIRQRGALDDVKRGDFTSAARKLGNEWQGLPTGTSVHQGSASWNSFNGAIKRSLSQSAAKPTTPAAGVAPVSSTEHKLPPAKPTEAPKSRVGATPLPPDLEPSAPSSQGRAGAPSAAVPLFKISADPITVQHVDQMGNQRQAPQTLVTKVAPAAPFGATAR